MGRSQAAQSVKRVQEPKKEKGVAAIVPHHFRTPKIADFGTLFDLYLKKEGKKCPKIAKILQISDCIILTSWEK